MGRTAFTVRRCVVPPRSERAYAHADWSDALVVVESGAIELEAMNGLRRTFVKGDVITVARTPLRVLRNSNSVQAVLVATSRVQRRTSPSEVWGGVEWSEAGAWSPMSSRAKRGQQFHDDTQA